MAKYPRKMDLSLDIGYKHIFSQVITKCLKQVHRENFLAGNNSLEARKISFHHSESQTQLPRDQKRWSD